MGWEVTDLQRRGAFENVRWVQQQTDLCSETQRHQTGTSIQHPFLSSPFVPSRHTFSVHLFS